MAYLIICTYLVGPVPDVLNSANEKAAQTQIETCNRSIKYETHTESSIGDIWARIR
jgi:hypothetical protein